MMVGYINNCNQLQIALFFIACTLLATESCYAYHHLGSASLLMDRRGAIGASSILLTKTASSDGKVAPKVTKKVAFDVRISRQDGTFYVRDDVPDEPQNRVFQGRIVLGLFGDAAPNHVEKFLRFVDSSDGGPVYSRSLFTKVDEATGLVWGGKIPSLEVTELQGAVALRYGDRLMSAPLWIEPTSLSHASRGLLTHSNFDVSPAFGITTFEDSRGLDRTHTVFGRILEDDGDFLDKVAALPTYAVDRPATSSLDTVSVVDDAATAVYNAQRDFFRNTAKQFGDSRVGKIYPGKLLRRVEVTRVEILR